MIGYTVDHEAFSRALVEYEKKLEIESAAIVRDVAKDAADFARKEPQPFKSHTGRLKRSIRYEGNGDMGARVFTDDTAPYAGYVEFGRGPVRPVNKPYLRFQIDGHWITTKFVKPAAPRPFMRPAHDYAEDQLDSRMAAMFAKLP